MALPSTWTMDVTSSTNIAANNWYHIAVERKNSNNITFFVNGTTQASQLHNDASATTGGINTTIGGNNGGNGFYGYIDELRWSKVARYNGTSFDLETAPYEPVPTNTITFEGISLISPADSLNSSSASLNYAFLSNATVTNANFTNATLYIYNGATKINTTLATNQFNQTNITWSGLTDADYKWNVQYCVVNTSTTICSMATANRTFNIDSTKPNTRILYPLNQSYNILVDAINFSVSDTHLQACRYSTNQTDNATITCGNNATVATTWGTYTVMFWANDTFGNGNVTYLTFTNRYATLHLQQLHLQELNYLLWKGLLFHH
jgi:hypothetical protein